MNETTLEYKRQVIYKVLHYLVFVPTSGHGEFVPNSYELMKRETPSNLSSRIFRVLLFGSPWKGHRFVK